MSFLLNPELYPARPLPDLDPVGRARVKTTPNLLHGCGLLLYPELYPYPQLSISTQLPPLEGVGVEQRGRDAQRHRAAGAQRQRHAGTHRAASILAIGHGDTPSTRP